MIDILPLVIHYITSSSFISYSKSFIIILLSNRYNTLNDFKYTTWLFMSYTKLSITILLHD